MKDKNSVNINKIMYLIQNRVDINLLDAFEWTALMYAVEKNNVELVKLLLQHGANKFIEGRIFSAYGGKIERTLINWHKEKKV
jgi:ankyrin repeat protein